MTNDELKKKILEIFEKAIGDWYEKDDGLFAEGYTPEEGDNRLKAFMADALIAAGIGDIREAEHRAARAERALRDELVQKAIRLGVTDICPWYIQALNEAERDLAEERKDENN